MCFRYYREGQQREGFRAHKLLQWTGAEGEWKFEICVKRGTSLGSASGEKLIQGYFIMEIVALILCNSYQISQASRSLPLSPHHSLF